MPPRPSLHGSSNGKPAPASKPPAARRAALQQLLGMVGPVPRKWLAAGGRGLTGYAAHQWGDEEKTLRIRSCEEWGELKESWGKALHWSGGLNAALITMLASSASTPLPGEQLWLKVIGPPSCGKTTLMEGLATAKKYYLSKDTIRGFHSGYKEKDNDEDKSLAQLVDGMTLGTKDGDTLLKAPNKAQILSEARALYDRASRTNYRNNINREYVGHSMTWHLAGTAALREIDDSELGARFLDVVVMDKITPEFEARVASQAASNEFDNLFRNTSEGLEAKYSDSLGKAMALTGGYLGFLRENIVEIGMALGKEGRVEVLHQCQDLAAYVAHMRARPGVQSTEDPEREFSPRLTKQLTQLAAVTACTLGVDDIGDPSVMDIVRKVAFDTSRGPTVRLMDLMVPQPQGMEVRGIASFLQQRDDKVREYLRFLGHIGVLQVSKNRKRWRVDPSMVELTERIHGNWRPELVQSV